MRAAQLSVRCRHCRGSARTELPRANRRYAPANVSVVDMGNVRELRSPVQRGNPAKAVERAKSIERYHAEAAAVSTPPRKKAVTRAERQPAKATPSAPTKSDTPSAAPAKE
jgi:hypothetical protein